MSFAPGSGEPPGERISPGVFTRRRRFHTDAAIAIGIVAFCLVVYAITLTFPHVPAALASGMGPEVFPRLLLVVLLLLAGMLALIGRGKPDEMRDPVPALAYWTALAMLAFMGILAVVGMGPAMFIGFVGIGLLWGERRWLILAFSGLVLSGAIYLLFVKGFGVPLPRGLVGEWLF
jgi:hypothetical protein